MLGVPITLFFSLCMVGFGRFLYGRWMVPLDSSARFGIAGILGLATVGLLTLPIGLLPNGLVWGMGVVWLFAGIGLVELIKARFWEDRLLSRKPQSLEWLFIAIAGVAVVIALVADLTPSSTLDWDTIAYHLAVPKLWLQAGHIELIPFIHHSNFPLSVDNLYIWGLSWGGQYGAKAFELSFYILGFFCVFGLTRARYGGKAAAWAALTFGTVPAVLWEAGTGYIDVAHGLFTAIAAILTVQVLEGIWDKREDGSVAIWPIAALCYGFSAGSKYTGLQGFLAAGLVFGGYALIRKRGEGVGKLAATFAIGLAVCAAWYVKNVAWVGNPVYPFFYEQFGGKNWDEYNASIYKIQQQSFGVPRTGPAGGLAAFPDAVLGLAFQPSRYTDPRPTLTITKDGPDGAGGFPWQAGGAAIIVAGVVWLLSGETKRYEGLLLTWIGVGLLMWFVLSQQSRYALSYAPILAMLLGAGVARLRAGPILAVVAAIQAVFTVGMLYHYQFQDDMKVVTGKISADQYLASSLPAYNAFEWLNQHAKGGKVALYDEVLGFYLDIPYFWANPGHSTLIGYDKLQDGQGFITRLKQMGFTHIYVSLQFGGYSRDQQIELRRAVGLVGGLGETGEPVPLSDARRQELVGNEGQKYKWLICDAAAKGLYSSVQDFGGGGFVLTIK